MAKILVPATLERANPLLAAVIRLKAKTQVEADKLIAPHVPGYVPTYDPESRAAERHKVQRGQAAGSYSLDTCQGGGSYHRASRVRRPDPCAPNVNEVAIRAVVHDVPEPVNLRGRIARPHVRGQARKAKIASRPPVAFVIPSRQQIGPTL